MLFSYATELSYRNLSQLFYCTCRKSTTAGAIVITRVIIQHVKWRQVTKDAITESRSEKKGSDMNPPPATNPAFPQLTENEWPAICWTASRL